MAYYTDGPTDDPAKLLAELLCFSEGPTLDYKQTMSVPSDELAKDIAALYNTPADQHAPYPEANVRYIVCGVDEKTKKVVGIPETQFEKIDDANYHAEYLDALSARPGLRLLLVRAERVAIFEISVRAQDGPIKTVKELKPQNNPKTKIPVNSVPFRRGSRTFFAKTMEDYIYILSGFTTSAKDLEPYMADILPSQAAVPTFWDHISSIALNRPVLDASLWSGFLAPYRFVFLFDDACVSKFSAVTTMAQLLQPLALVHARSSREPIPSSGWIYPADVEVIPFAVAVDFTEAQPFDADVAAAERARLRVDFQDLAGKLNALPGLALSSPILVVVCELLSPAILAALHGTLNLFTGDGTALQNSTAVVVCKQPGTEHRLLWLPQAECIRRPMIVNDLDAFMAMFTRVPGVLPAQPPSLQIGKNPASIVVAVGRGPSELRRVNLADAELLIQNQVEIVPAPRGAQLQGDPNGFAGLNERESQLRDFCAGRLPLPWQFSAEVPSVPAVRSVVNAVEAAISKDYWQKRVVSIVGSAFSGATTAGRQAAAALADVARVFWIPTVVKPAVIKVIAQWSRPTKNEPCIIFVNGDVSADVVGQLKTFSGVILVTIGRHPAPVGSGAGASSSATHVVVRLETVLPATHVGAIAAFYSQVFPEPGMNVMQQCRQWSHLVTLAVLAIRQLTHPSLPQYIVETLLDLHPHAFRFVCMLSLVRVCPNAQADLATTAIRTDAKTALVKESDLRGALEAGLVVARSAGSMTISSPEFANAVLSYVCISSLALDTATHPKDGRRVIPLRHILSNARGVDLRTVVAEELEQWRAVNNGASVPLLRLAAVADELYAALLPITQTMSNVDRQGSQLRQLFWVDSGRLPALLASVDGGGSDIGALAMWSKFDSSGGSQSDAVQAARQLLDAMFRGAVSAQPPFWDAAINALKLGSDVATTMTSRGETKENVDAFVSDCARRVRSAEVTAYVASIANEAELQQPTYIRGMW